MNYYLHVLKNYAQFSGRASRSEYWYFFFINLLISFALGFIEALLGISSTSEFSTLANIYQLVVLIPNIAVGIRRMHDVNKSGWYMLIPFYNLYLECQPGTPGNNSFGPAPKPLN